jgi:hypothetical protein
VPHIIVIADKATEDGEQPIMFRERVSVSDFESDHFATQLVERLGWAVGDADEVNRRPALKPDRRRTQQRVIDAAQRELGRPERGSEREPDRPERGSERELDRTEREPGGEHDTTQRPLRSVSVVTTAS